VADPNSWEKGEDTEVFVIIVTILIFITPISCKEWTYRHKKHNIRFLLLLASIRVIET